MRRSAWMIPLVLGAVLFGPGPLQAQQASPPLNATQKLGRQLFTQSCMVCHTAPQLNAGLYGPALSKDAAGGEAAVMRGVIADGTPRMPAFKYLFRPKQIDAIVAYLKTVPAPAAASGGGNKGGMD